MILLFCVSVLFIILKILGYITWSWFWVTAPATFAGLWAASKFIGEMSDTKNHIRRN